MAPAPCRRAPLTQLDGERRLDPLEERNGMEVASRTPLAAKQLDVGQGLLQDGGGDRSGDGRVGLRREAHRSPAGSPRPCQGAAMYHPVPFGRDPVDRLQKTML